MESKNLSSSTRFDQFNISTENHVLKITTCVNRATNSHSTLYLAAFAVSPQPAERRPLLLFLNLLFVNFFPFQALTHTCVKLGLPYSEALSGLPIRECVHPLLVDGHRSFKTVLCLQVP